ncbi:MAG: DUF2945 domain-containing protein [Phormidesmis sp.]
MASQQKFHKGDRVQWSSGQGTATGTIEACITEEQTVEGQTVSASSDDPRYLVKNSSTGTVTGHRPETLSAADSSKDSGSEGSNSFQTGDRVQWETAQGKTTGTIQKKLTSETDIKGYTAKASKEDPQYLVKSDSTGAEAAHKPSALKPID